MNLLLAPFRFLAAMWRAFWDWWTLRRVFARPATVDARRAICEACPERRGPFCGGCACVVALKTSLRREACPRGKW